ncbi:Metallo-beta-lactamase family protein, RNA-specific [hydrothermal vent metagenome]|uniref:Metallo-beta-lactamase family protein, RNA-specific n=1 Tax=hydrothermal vent metagenome TaxID=652676 RepID=A0A3B0VAM5_9ZZZZ
MKITFLGATGTVTGSKYLINTSQANLLMDCGLFQGYKSIRSRNWDPLPFNIELIDAVLLTHAHLDHSGMIPLLYKYGYRGPVYCSQATFKLCELLLKDSGHLQEEEAKFRNKHRLSRHQPAKPLYDFKTAKASLSLFVPVDYEKAVTVKDAKIEFSPVGHILGATSIRVESNGKSIIATGDVGRPNDLIMHPPQALKDCDYLLIESTYGNRLHEKHDPVTDLENIVNASIAKGGSILIPSFSVGRAQAIMFVLAELIKDKRIPKLPIFLDSPMAINASDIYSEFEDEHRLNIAQCHEMYDKVTCTKSIEESKHLASLTDPHIIISANGMATGGRVLHHLIRFLPDNRNTIVFTGYQAGGTRGQKLRDGAKHLQIFGREVEVTANIEKIPSFSAHADYREMIDWLKQSKNLNPKQVFVVHGEADAADEFRLRLKKEFGWHITVPYYLSEF